MSGTPILFQPTIGTVGHVHHAGWWTMAQKINEDQNENMKNSHKALLLTVLGLSVVSAAQAQYAPNNADSVYLGLNDANTLNDYVLKLPSANKWTTTAILTGSLDVSGNTIFSVFGADSGYQNNVNIGLYGGPASGISDFALQTRNQSALAISDPAGDWPINGSTLSGVPLGASAKSGSSSWDSIVEISPSTPGSSLFGSISSSTTGLFMDTAVAGLYSQEVYLASTDDGSTVSSVTHLGTLTVNLNNDTWAFNGANASVPEPSTYSLMAGAGLLVIGFRRRFIKKNA